MIQLKKCNRGLFISLMVSLLFSIINCATVQPDERGVTKTFGKLDDEILKPGLVWYNPLFTTLVTVPTRTVNREVQLSLPSREGTTIQADISILYKVKPEAVISILQNIGEEYENTIIITSFRSAAADITSRHLAKEMHSSQRTNIGNEIRDLMNQSLAQRGFEIESVMLKSISLPAGLARSIEEKLQAEQDAQRMQFVLAKEEMEAKRKIVEAQGIRDSQKIISQGMAKNVLQWRSIEAFKELANSPNTKIIITDGKTPLLVPEGN